MLPVSPSENNVYDGIVSDAADPAFLKEVLDKDKDTYIINCIGILNPFAEVSRLNALLINFIFLTCRIREFLL